jgi:hypothetical protein
MTRRTLFATSDLSAVGDVTAQADGTSLATCSIRPLRLLPVLLALVVSACGPAPATPAAGSSAFASAAPA